MAIGKVEGDDVVWRCKGERGKGWQGIRVVKGDMKSMPALWRWLIASPDGLAVDLSAGEAF